MAVEFFGWIHRHRTAVGLALLGSTALVARLGLLFVAGVHAEGNAFEHGEIAENLLSGRGFSVKYLGVDGPTSQQAPLYPLLLAATSVLRGFNAPSLTAVEVLQCFAGTATALVSLLLGWTLFPQQRAIGWTAGWIAALFPSHLYMATQIQVVVWATLLLTWLALLASRSPGRAPWRQAILLGITAGLLLLVEPILALTLPIIAIEAWRRDWRASSVPWFATGPALRASLVAFTALVVITPWLIRNYHVHGQFVFIKSSFGYAFWQGNNEASWGTDKIPKVEAERMRAAHDGTLAGLNRALWNARHETIYIDDLLLQPCGYREFQGLSEPQRSQLLMDRAKTAIANDPARYFRLCAQRLRYFLLFDETNPKAANQLYRAMTVVWLVLTLLGLLVTRSEWRVLWPTWAIFGLVTLFHTLTITSARFRMPLEPITFVWIAAGVAPLGVRLQSHVLAVVASMLRRLRTMPAKPPTAPIPQRDPPKPHIPVGGVVRPRHSSTASSKR